jgi:hypothetical protein
LWALPTLLAVNHYNHSSEVYIVKLLSLESIYSK